MQCSRLRQLGWERPGGAATSGPGSRGNPARSHDCVPKAAACCAASSSSCCIRLGSTSSPHVSTHRKQCMHAIVSAEAIISSVQRHFLIGSCVSRCLHSSSPIVSRPWVGWILRGGRDEVADDVSAARGGRQQNRWAAPAGTCIGCVPGWPGVSLLLQRFPGQGRLFCLQGALPLGCSAGV